MLLKTKYSRRETEIQEAASGEKEREEEAMRYYISDLHFFHGALNTHMDCRGFASVEEMNQYMIGQWNRKVRHNDEVVILGDFSIGKGEETNAILRKLKGRLYLIRGNHDHFVKDRMFDASRFVWIKDYAEISDNRKKIVLSHYPVFCYNGQNRRDEMGNPKTYMLYGHVHDSLDEQLVQHFQEVTRRFLRGDAPIPCNMLNCFCMYSDYTPLTLNEWVDVHQKRAAVRKTLENGL